MPTTDTQGLAAELKKAAAYIHKEPLGEAYCTVDLAWIRDILLAGSAVLARRRTEVEGLTAEIERLEEEMAQKEASIQEQVRIIEQYHRTVSVMRTQLDAVRRALTEGADHAEG